LSTKKNEMRDSEAIVEKLSKIKLYRTHGSKGISVKDRDELYELVIEARRYFINTQSKKVERQAAHSKNVDILYEKP